MDVLEVHAKKNITMRGQAFIVCGDEDQATSAIAQLRNNVFFGKPLRLSYASAISDVIAKTRGQFVEDPLRVDKRSVGAANKDLKKKMKMIQRLFQLKE